eukprot:m.195125 g.195125  ORF g.195125 m.195125 type:complete len:80 (-) comp16997_c0_seq3:63-302(-)
MAMLKTLRTKPKVPLLPLPALPPNVHTLNLNFALHALTPCWDIGLNRVPACLIGAWLRNHTSDHPPSSLRSGCKPCGPH